MSSAAEMPDETTSVRTLTARRLAAARWLGVLGRSTAPHILFPVVALVVLSTLWTATVKIISEQDRSARHAAAVAAPALLETYEAQVVRALREIDGTLKVVQYAAETQGISPVVMAKLQERSLLPPNLVFAVSLIDARGVVVASTEAEHSPRVTDQHFFLTLRDHPLPAGQELYIDPPRREGKTGEWRLRFSRRLKTPGGAFAGVATLSVDAAYFVSGYDISKLGLQGVLGVLGTDGQFLARRSGDAVSAGDTVRYDALVLPRPGGEDAPAALVRNPWDHVLRYTSVRGLYEFPLAVIVGLSAQEQLASVSHDRRRDLLIASAASALVILLAGILGRLSWKLLASQRRESAEKIAHAERLEFVAYHDGLTGLPNRGLFSKLLSRAIKLCRRNERQLAVLFIDLDRFKQVNDTLGHGAGDQLLQEVARRLESCLRDSDTVARLGGDEFVVLLPELESPEYAAVVAQNVLAKLSQPFALSGQEFRVTGSIGICTYPQDGVDEQTLTKHADIAMYQAKMAGKNTFQFYSENINANSLERLTLESSLRHALERREFELHYQPKHDSGGERIIGVEVLLRWQHPDLGTVAPMRFIPIAEETGLIVPIGKWVLRTACLQNVAWKHQGHPGLSIGVNLTPRQFADEGLLSDIASILDETGMQPDLLEVEISESLLRRDAEKTIRVMTELKSMGIRICVDDFGTFYSSLANLRQFPLDAIKIDRSLIRDCTSAGDPGPECRKLADAIIAMGHCLSLTVVAQGIETRSQADELRGYACDEVQGFYFSRPVPSGLLTQLLRAQAPLSSGTS